MRVPEYALIAYRKSTDPGDIPHTGNSGSQCYSEKGQFPLPDNRTIATSDVSITAINSEFQTIKHSPR
ncbi:hypothetical protein HZH66_012507 [Vespula vulgaris]|uniref:Uncharacterized protein n=1 Tax=Vespula vulgaris TaxID=7454 RepID=A0A834MT05_VESVU|nr:hypothetical protein HZH66_012507 [Vespula vulgaris]